MNTPSYKIGVFFGAIIVVVLNWSLKLLVAWIMFLLATWLDVPQWVMIAMIAVGAAESKFVRN